MTAALAGYVNFEKFSFWPFATVREAYRNVGCQE
jgi:hypothetical protein